MAFFDALALFLVDFFAFGRFLVGFFAAVGFFYFCITFALIGGFKLLEGLAGALAEGALGLSPAIEAVTVRVRKLAVGSDFT